MANKAIITPAEFDATARKYQKTLLRMPILGIKSTTRFMTEMAGIRGDFVISEADFNAQFAPYKASRSGKTDLGLKVRALSTYFGNCVEKFDPNSLARTVFATAATKGEDLKKTPAALMALGSLSKNLSMNLNGAVWNAEQDPSGDTSKQLFDGFDTITQKELTATNLSASLGNYVKMTTELTEVNAVDEAEKWMSAMADELKEEDTFLFCTHKFYSDYCKAYKATGAGLPYNETYEKVYVEGSNKKCTLVPLSNKKGTNFFHITTKRNMLVGYNQMGDEEKVEVLRFDPNLLTFNATIYFGVQFATLDKRQLMVVDLRTA